MTVIYVPRLIESAEQAEALPVGTLAKDADLSVAVKAEGGYWARTDVADGLPMMGGSSMDGWTALVPIEAEEETQIDPQGAAPMKPRRIQQRRTKGWRKPEGAVAVGRGTKWGNPWKIHEPEKWDGVLIQQGKNRQYLFVTPEIAVALYRLWVTHGHANDVPYRHPFGPDLEELRGKDLMCWCPLDQPCHADVLLELANGDPR